MTDYDVTDAVLRSRPKGLAGLISSTSEGSRLWGALDLQAIFRHQLAAPVLIDLSSFEPGQAVRLQNLSNAHDLLLKSFAELFRHPIPPVELLELTKDFAKANMNHPESAVPSEVAAALYYSSIAAGVVKLRVQISKLSEAELIRGLSWAKEQTWVDAETKELLNEAVRILPSIRSEGKTPQ